jgi:transcriptional regulator with PAS, ATPase and Fis domain
MNVATALEQIIGKSKSLKTVLDQLDKISQSDVTVLIEGESGTGKELVARAIHYHGPRKTGEFVIINCSAFSDALLESELFGHVKGAFTGAVHEKKGLFEIADQGTFFLDEIGDMSPALQVKLLRVLQEGAFFKVGGTSPVKVNVRIIAATNKDLKTLTRENKFREDLFYRIHVVKLFLPALRDRKEDIPLLIEHFLNKLSVKNSEPFKKLDRAATELFMRYDWPGNIRQLENELERAWILSSDTTLPVSLFRHLEEEQRTTRILVDWSQEATLPQVKQRVNDQLEQDAFQWMLGQTKGNKAEAARKLGISRQDLMRKLKPEDSKTSKPSKKRKK